MTIRTVWSAVVLLAGLWGGCKCQGLDGSQQSWDFNSYSNPAAPSVISNITGAGSATIKLGFLAVGWQYSMAGFGNEVGVWDLGLQDPNQQQQDTRGSIGLSVPLPPPTSSNSYVDVWVRVVQYVDGGIYTGELEFEPPSLFFRERKVIETLDGVGGRWVEDLYEGRVAPSRSPLPIKFTGAMFGTIVSKVEVTTTGPVSLPEDIVITSVVQQGTALRISWVGGKAPYQVYTTGNLLESESWQPSGSAVADNFAELPLTEWAAFIRVRGSE